MFAVPFAIAMLAAAPVAGAQDDAAIYMGIDLNADPVPVDADEPQSRSVGVELDELLGEGVELGCLAFDPPASFSQTDNDSEACRTYIAGLAEASSPEDEAEAATQEPATPMARVPLVTLARAAQSGNKQAQLELGMRFEEGRDGLEIHFGHARELYRAAGRATPARNGIRVRESTAGVGGGVNRRQISPRIPGLREARERLEALEARLETDG